MPIVRIELFRGRTKEQKANAAREVTEALSRTIMAAPDSIQIIFVDVEKSDWAHAGVLYDNK